jgi:hypothetical protein
MKRMKLSWQVKEMTTEQLTKYIAECKDKDLIEIAKSELAAR